MAEKIKNCPFCGDIAMKMLIFGRDGIGCIGCGAMMRPATIEDDVRNDWNKRAADAEVRAKAIDEFVKALDIHCGYYKGENKNVTRDDVLKIAEQLKAGGK